MYVVSNVVPRCRLLSLLMLPMLLLSACGDIPQMPKAAALYDRGLDTPILHTEPVRGDVKPLAFMMDGDAYQCTMCHEEYTGEAREAALEGFHASIKFDHGRNARCINCHNPTSPDTYVDRDGSEIPGDNPTLLCAKCHGPHYREWDIGVHGRNNTHWDKKFGERPRLQCIQCHDPHHPDFQLMEPEPAPVLTRFENPKHGEIKLIPNTSDITHQPGEPEHENGNADTAPEEQQEPASEDSEHEQEETAHDE